MFKIDPLHPLSTATVNGLSNVVTELHWFYEGTVNERLYKIHGPKIVLSSPEASSFTEFSSLTEDQVNSWIESSMTPEQRQWYIDRIAENEQCAVETHERWVADRDAWNAEQQLLLDNGEIEEVESFSDIEPSWPNVIDLFCQYPVATEQSFPWD
jgi:hypothetical protein